MKNGTIALVGLPRMLEDIVRQVFENQFELTSFIQKDLKKIAQSSDKQFLAFITQDSERLSAKDVANNVLQVYPDCPVICLGNNGVKAQLLKLKLEVENYSQLNSKQLLDCVTNHQSWKRELDG